MFICKKKETVHSNERVWSLNNVLYPMWSPMHWSSYQECRLSLNQQSTNSTYRSVYSYVQTHTYGEKKLERNNEYGLYWWNSLTAFCAFHWRTSLSASNTQTQSTLKSYAWNTCYRERDFIIVYVYMHAYKKRGSDSNHCLDIFIRITWLNWIASQKC